MAAPATLSLLTVTTVDVVIRRSGIGNTTPIVGMCCLASQIEERVIGCDLNFQVQGSHVPLPIAFPFEMNEGWEQQDCQRRPRLSVGVGCTG